MKSCRYLVLFVKKALILLVIPAKAKIQCL